MFPIKAPRTSFQMYTATEGFFRSIIPLRVVHVLISF